MFVQQNVSAAEPLDASEQRRARRNDDEFVGLPPDGEIGEGIADVAEAAEVMRDAIGLNGVELSRPLQVERFGA